MKQRHQEGFIEGLIIALGLVAILILFIIPKAPPGSTSSLPSLLGGSSGSLYQPQNTNNANNTNPNLSKDSVFANNISLNTGNASYSFEPADEYISLANNSNKPITITGWKLQNAKGNRAYNVGNSLQYFPANAISIPAGVYILSPTGANDLQNIILKPNESAIVTTGSVGVTSPYRIVSFKENECTGYIENLPNYYFTPSLQMNCVQPRNEPGVRNLDTPCQDYISGMSSCHTPKFDTVDTQGRLTDSQGNSCFGCVDGNSTLSSSCVAFIKSHFSYPGCLAYHRNDSNFSGSEWRIYLGQQWELWASKYETISLFDSLGKLVDYQSY
jgi:hypothetical protein